MSRLVCTDHKKRSLILPDGKIVHRSGEKCSAKGVRIAGNIYTIAEAIRQFTRNSPVEVKE